MSTRVHALVAEIEAAHGVQCALGDAGEALDLLELSLNDAATSGKGLGADVVRELWAAFQTYQAERAREVDVEGRKEEALRTLLLELRHPAAEALLHSLGAYS